MTSADELHADVDHLVARCAILEENLANARDERRQILTSFAAWLAEIGYGTEFFTEEPLPQGLRGPLAGAYLAKEGTATGHTVGDYYDMLADECRWPRRETT